MITQTSNRLIASYKSISKLASLTIIAVGVSVIVGWMFNIQTLKSVFPGLVAMKANTALAFILSGLSLWLLRDEQKNQWARLTGQLSALLVLLIGLFSLSQYVFGWDLGIDQLLFQEPLGAVGTSDPGRMAPPTALNFIFLGLVLILLKWQRAYVLVQFFTLTVALIGLLYITGYVYGVKSHYGIASYTVMAVHTAGAFFVFSVAIFLARPAQGLMAIIASDNMGGIIARRLIPSAIVVPLLFGWLRLVGQKVGKYDLEFGAGLFALSSIIVFGIIIWWNAGLLNRTDAERKYAEEETRRAQRFLDSIIENIPNMIFVKDARELRFVHFNKAGEELLGHSREELIGKNDYDFLPKSEADFFTAKDRLLLENGRLLDIPEEVIDTRNWGKRILHTKKIPIADQNGKIQYLLGISEDITERKQAEERFIKAVEFAPQAILLVNREGKIVLANQNAENYFGYTRQELLEQAVEILVPEALRARHPQHRQAFFNDPRTRSLGAGRELYAQRKDDTIFPVEIGLSPIETEQGTLALATIVDITARKQAEEEIKRLNVVLEQRNHQLEVSNKELEAFSYSVSHDLRTPLRSIDGFSQALLEDHSGKLGGSGEDYLRRVRSATQRMGQLIDDMLNLARVSRYEISPERVNLSVLVQTIAEELKNTDANRQVEFVIAPDLSITGDTRLLRLALQNLFDNAWKFTSKQKLARIEFGVQWNNGTPVFFVRDNGAGFDMAYADKLFGAFQRLHPATDFPGSGIGLATVQRIIHRHGGRVWAEGAVDQGATIYFTL